MARKKYSPEEIIQHLRTLDIEKAKGATLEQVARKIGVNPVTLSRWKKEYSGLDVSKAKKLKDLEKENARLKKLLAEAELDKAALKEVVSGNF
jgi:putative transposase